MIFKYKAKDGIDKVVAGQMDVPSEQILLERLHAQGLFPLEISGAAEKNRVVQSRVSYSEILLFTRQLLIFVRAGEELLRAFEKIASGYSFSRAMRSVLCCLLEDIRHGSELSSALAAYPGVFSPLYISMIRAGEKTGSLEASLSLLIDNISAEEAMRKKMFQALIYPAFLMLAGCLSVFVMFYYVIPKLEPALESLNTGIPVITKIIFSLSHFFAGNIWIFSVVFVFIPAALFMYGGKIAGKIIYSVPLLGKMFREGDYARLASSLSLQISCGVPPLEAISTAADIFDDTDTRAKIYSAVEYMRQGNNISSSLANTRAVPEFFLDMLSLGEESGQLSAVLLEISSAYRDSARQKGAVVNALIEPVMVLFFGIILGGVIVSLLLPLFDVASMIK